MAKVLARSSCSSVSRLLLIVAIVLGSRDYAAIGQSTAQSLITRPSNPAQSNTARLPLVFEPNRGQTAADVQYLLRGGVFQGEFQNDGVLLKLLDDKGITSQLKMRLVGSREHAEITGGGALEGHTNYLVGDDPTR